MTKRILCLLIAAVSLTSCGDEDTTEISKYLPPTSPRNVLMNLQQSYLDRNADEYGKLLADDFRFYINEDTRRQNPSLPEFWTSQEDSTPRIFIVRV